MTNRERVLASLEHRQPDRIPYNIRFTEPAREAMAAFYGDPDFESHLGNCLHILHTEPAGSWREVQPGTWEDQFGVHWDRSIDRDIGNVCNVRVTPDTLASFRFPDPDEPTRFADHADLIAKHPGPVPRDRHRLQPLRARLDAGRHGERSSWPWWTTPAFAHDLLDRIVEFNLALIEKACALPDRRHDVRRRLGPAARPAHGTRGCGGASSSRASAACTRR